MTSENAIHQTRKCSGPVMKIRLEDGAKVSESNGRRVRVKLQEAVNVEILKNVKTRGSLVEV